MTLDLHAELKNQFTSGVHTKFISTFVLLVLDYPCLLTVEGNNPMVHLGEHLYDNSGNKIGLRGFDRRGNQIPFSWGNLTHAAEFDDRGFITKSTTYLPDGSINLRLSYEYTKDGTRQQRLKSLDSKGVLKDDPRLGGGAIVEYNYGPDGTRTSRVLHADGQPLKDKH